MRHTIWLAALALVGLQATALEAQTDQEIVERALAAAPGSMADAAAVVRFNSDYMTWETLKEGASTWVCFDRSGEPMRRPFDAQCTHVDNLPRVAQNRSFEAEAEDRQALRAMVAAAGEDGTRVPAKFGSMWIRRAGNDMESAGFHSTIAVPGATGASTGLPVSRDSGGAYLMAGGTSEAHIMLPGR